MKRINKDIGVDISNNIYKPISSLYSTYSLNHIWKIVYPKNSILYRLNNRFVINRIYE